MRACGAEKASEMMGETPGATSTEHAESRMRSPAGSGKMK